MTRKKKITYKELEKCYNASIIIIAIAFAVFIGLSASLFITTSQFESEIHNMAKAMCYGQGAFDGKLYFKTVGSSEQLILRCYYVKSYGILRKETVLGWLPKEMRE